MDGGQGPRVGVIGGQPLCGDWRVLIDGVGYRAGEAHMGGCVGNPMAR